jgi:hypothetical protein
LVDGNFLTVVVQDIDWVPLEVVGSVIAEVRNASSRIVQIKHPEPVAWRYVLDRIAQTLNVPIVPFHDWLSELEALAATIKAKETPAIALLEAFREADRSDARFVPRMSIENALRESPAFAAAQPLTEKDIDS